MTTRTHADAAKTGWYGKLPGLGDFASRRLPAGFVSVWDGWLAGVLADSRDQLGERWLDCYLTCPVWRFAYASQAGGWTGVLMPSVDRVGRHFPLTVAAPLPALPGSADELLALWRWLDGAESAALAALEREYDAAEFDAALAGLGEPPTARGVAPACFDGHSVWLARTARAPVRLMHAIQGLPRGETFCAMLASSAACGDDSRAGA